jgi:RNA polymerase sigma factor (sigma-70 family)
LLWWGTPEQKFVNNLLAEDIERALNGISDVFREVVLMVEVMGFTYEEVATSMDVPVGTVRSRLNRGRRLLQNALWQNARDAGIVQQAATLEES